MNRRDLMLTGVGAAIAGAVLPQAAWATPQSWIGWGPGAKENPHAALVLKWIGEQVDAGEMYIATDTRLLDDYVVLEQPRFLIETGPKVWNFSVGDSEEPGLQVTIWVKDQRVSACKVASTFGSYIIAPQDQGYRMRVPHVAYEHEKVLEAAGVQFRRELPPWLLEPRPTGIWPPGTVTGRVAHIIPTSA